MRISFTYENNAVTDYIAECRAIARTYFRDDGDVALRVEEIPNLPDGCPNSGTFIVYDDGTDEFIFD